MSSALTSDENTGHGHVFPRPDGVKARCGGPAICRECAFDLARKNGGALGDAPIEEKYHAQMTAVAEALDEIFNPGQKAPHKKVGFVLLTYEYGTHDGRCNFLSNGADRRDIVTLFREMIARFEGQPEVSGRG